MPKLIFEQDGKTYNFEIGEFFRIGRHPDNDLPINETKVSRQHADIKKEGERYSIIDLDSLNGTWINGQRVKSRILQNGDTIQIGSRFFKWVDSKAADSDVYTSGPNDIVKPIDKMGILDAPMPGVPDAVPSYASVPEHLRLLLQIARRLNMAPNVDSFLQTALDLVLGTINAQRAAVFIMEGDQLIPCKIMSRKADQHNEIPISRSIVNKVMKDGVGILTTDARNDPRFDQGMSIQYFDIRSAICAPLWEGNMARGVFYLDNPAVDKPLTEADLDLAAAVAHHIALGIRHFKIVEFAKREAVMRNQLARYHSPDVVDLLLKQTEDKKQVGISLQEREVTILFTDIVNFTHISSKMTPSEIASMLNNFYSAMASVIFEYSGSINKFIGDAIMALWGAPFRREDDPALAAKCAAHMLKSLYKMLMKADSPQLFKIRIGINTGKVIAGHLGSEEMLEYTVVGTPVNVASRLESIAKPNQILIGETTKNYLGPEFPTTDLGKISVKGVEQPINVFELLWQEIPD